MQTPSKRSATNRPRNARRSGRAAVSRKNKRLPWVIVGLAFVVLVAGGVFLAVRGQAGTIEGLTTFTVSQGHMEGDLTYEQTPPAGGTHNGAWQNCGTYAEPIRNENAVHSLEHGAVWITYRPDLPTDAIQQLRSMVRDRSYMLLSPYPDLPAPVVASAWGVQLKADGAADPRLSSFITTYRQGPQSPEPGASCSGALGKPVS